MEEHIVKLAAVLTDVSEHINATRRLYDLCHTTKFRITYNEATDDERQVIVDLIGQLNILALKDFLRTIATLESYTLVALRQLGSHLGIQYYNTLSKKQLIWKIRDVRKRQNSEIPAGCQSMSDTR